MIEESPFVEPEPHDAPPDAEPLPSPTPSVAAPQFRDRSTIQLFKRQWINGGKGLLMAALLCAAAVGFLASTICIAAIRKDRSSYSPISVQSPETLVGPSVIYVGGPINIRSTKCNNSTKAINTDGITFWQNIDDPAQRVAGQLSLGVVQKPGCITKIAMYTVPPTLAPGRWRLEGHDVTYSDSGQRQDVVWFSDDFLVCATATGC